MNDEPGHKYVIAYRKRDGAPSGTLRLVKETETEFVVERLGHPLGSLTTDQLLGLEPPTSVAWVRFTLSRDDYHLIHEA